MKTKYKWMSLFTLVLLTSGMVTAQNTAQNADERSISVSGSGTVYGEPDVALLELGVDITNEDLNAASSEADETMTRVRDALLSAGVAEKDIRTLTFNIWREQPYAYDSSPRSEPAAPLYHVTNVVQVTVREVGRAGEVLSSAVDAGANLVNGVQYTFSNSDALERQARELAFADAQSKAQQLASLAGVTLGPVLSISESGGFGGEPFYGDFAVMAESTGAAPVSGGQLAVTVTVSARFLLYGQEQ